MALLKHHIIILLISILLCSFPPQSNAFRQPIREVERGDLKHGPLSPDPDTAIQATFNPGPVPSLITQTSPSQILSTAYAGRQDIEDDIVNRREFDAEDMSSGESFAPNTRILHGRTSDAPSRIIPQFDCKPLDILPIFFFNDKNAAKIAEHRKDCLCWESQAIDKSFFYFNRCKKKQQIRPDSDRVCILARENLSGCCDAHIKWEMSIESKKGLSAMSDQCSCFWSSSSGRILPVEGCEGQNWLRHA